MTATPYPFEPDSSFANWAYSDASMQPYGQRAVLAAVFPNRTVTMDAFVTSIAEAELRAAELAVSLAPEQEPLRLHVDNPFVMQAITAQFGHGLAFRSLGHDIAALAEARGIQLEVRLVPAGENRAHGPAVARYRTLECRPRLEYTLTTNGPLVRVRGSGVDFHGVYEAPAGFYAVCELARHLPPGVIAQVKGLLPLAWTYWHSPKTGGRQAVKRAQIALKILGEKGSDIHLWKRDRPHLLRVIK